MRRPGDARLRACPGKLGILILGLMLLLGGCVSGTSLSGLNGQDAGLSGEERLLALGRQYTEWFYRGELESLHGCCAGNMKQVFDPERLQTARRNLVSELGQERKILNERTDGCVASATGCGFYIRTVEFEKVSAPVQLGWTLGPDGVILDFTIGPEAKEADQSFLDYQTKASLRLPFSGEWFVLWGGRTIEENRHAADPTLRFAYNLLIARDGSTHRGDGRRNQQYYCFGQPVLAPADGRVVEAIDGIHDNLPGLRNRSRPLGNHVIVYHGEGEYSVLAHLQEGSIAVGPQEYVKAGQRLGLCGNSGDSSEPHLHYHLQDALSGGHGLPAQFQSYLADGKEVERGEPVRGQFVRPR